MGILLPEYEETTAVDSWYKYQFEPYYNRLVEFIALWLQYQFSDTLLQKMNDKLLEMAAFKAYLTSNPNGFKPNAHYAQMQKVEEAFKIIELKIVSFLMSQGVTLEKFVTTANSSQFKYDPIVLESAFIGNAENYRLAVVRSDGSLLVTPNYPVDPAANSETATTTQQATALPLVAEPPAQSKSSTGMLVGLGLAAAIIFAIIKNKKDKKQK